MFVITRFHHVGVLFDVFYITGAKNTIRYSEDFVVEVIKLRFHCI